MKWRFLILSSIGFFLLLSVLVWGKIRYFDFELSGLIGIWRGFLELNPDYIPKGFVFFEEGGYDGQFFFILSQYLFHSDSLPFPILDSFYFRFHRLGLSLIAGLIVRIIGIEFYPIITLVLLATIHIISFYFLYSFLPANKKPYSLFYLFNPYSLIGTLLLVSDPFLISLGLISCLLIYNVGEKDPKRYMILTLGMLLFSLSLLVRETSLFLLIPLFLTLLLKKEYYKLFFLSPPLLFYSGFLLFSQSMEVTHPGTSPLKFLDMIDYPYFGFVKSWDINLCMNISMILKESVKGFLFLLYVLLILQVLNPAKSILFEKNIRKGITQLLLVLPLLGTALVITIAEEGYWRSFDNITRMFTITTPLVVIGKSIWEDFNDYGFLYSSLVLTGFVILRVLFITKPLTYNLN